MSDPKQEGRNRERKDGGSGRGIARTMFYLHLWVGVPVTGLLLVISVTGMLLNHKKPLGLMPDPPGVTFNHMEGSTPEALGGALPLRDLVQAALDAYTGPESDPRVDRMDVRPDKGLVKVRFDDSPVTEVSVALNSGEVLEVGPRQDVFLEKLHSGEIFGSGFVALTTVVGGLLIVLTLSGFWIWLYPKSRVGPARPRRTNPRSSGPGDGRLSGQHARLSRDDSPDRDAPRGRGP